MNQFATRKVCLLAALVALSASTLFSAAAQPRELFSSPPSEPALLPSEQASLPPSRTREPPASDLPRSAARLGAQTIRWRTANIDLEYLAATRARLGSDSSSAVGPILNLFPDTRFRATAIRFAPTLSGYSLTGSLENFKVGTVTIAVSENVVAGSIRTGEATYTIRSVGEGLVEIRQVDPTTLPPGAEPVIPSTPQARAPRAFSTHAAEGTLIDVLIVWTPAAREEAGGTAEIRTLIDLYLAEANQAYDDGGVSLALNLLHSQEVAYVESELALGVDLNRLADRDGYIDDVIDLGDRFGADLIQLVAGAGQDVCGIASTWGLWLTADGERSVSPIDRSRFSVIRYDCHDGALAHEFGHNMGLVHDRYVDADDQYKAHPYAHGYVNQTGFEVSATGDQRWMTIMAYRNQCADAGITCGRVLRFSNPDQTHFGDPLGISGDEETWSLDGPVDARRALNDSRGLVAQHREERAVLGLKAQVSVAALQADQDFTVEAEVHNRGRRKSSPATIHVYRSADRVISPDDTELASVSLAEVEARSVGRESIEVTALSDWGNHYLGVCVDSDSAPQPCSAPVEVSVGPTVSIAPARAPEGENMAFAVTLSSAQDQPVTVAWAVSSVTAAEAVDYAATESPSLTILAGDTRAFISVPTLDDQRAEPDDVLVAALSYATVGDNGPFALSLDARTADGTIVDDDGKLSIPDPKLRMALLTALGKNPGEAIEESDLATLRQLDWSWTKRLEVGADFYRDRLTDLTGLEFATNLIRLNLSGNHTIGDLAPIAHLPKLTVLNLWFSNVRTIAPLAYLKGLRELNLSSNQISDIAPLEALSSLEKLDLRHNQISAISAVSRMSDLEELWLSNNRIRSLEPLRSLRKLRRLWLSYNPISSLAPLAGLTDMRRLGAFNTGTSDVSPLSEMTKLAYLGLAHNAISDVSVLGRLTACAGLVLDGNAITDVSALAGFTKLLNLSLNDNRISDLSPLSSLIGLDTLELSGNSISGLHGLAPLTGLTVLSLARNGVKDLAPLSDLASLSRLDLSDNLVSDVTPLRALIRLRWLDLSGNVLTDITPLASLRALNQLWLADNAISDIAPLGEMERLEHVDLANNRVADIAVLAADSSVLRWLYVHGNPLSKRSAEEHVPFMRDLGVDVYNVALSIAGVSVKEGEGFETPLRLSEPVADDVVASVFALGNTQQGRRGVVGPGDIDYFGGSAVTISAGSTEVLVAGRAASDSEDEPHETFTMSVEGESLPVGVGFSRRDWEAHRRLDWPDRAIYEGPPSAEVNGLIVDESGPFFAVPLVAPADHATRQGFVRVVNPGPDRLVHIEARDRMGANYAPVTLTVGKGRTTHFNSDDLEDGNVQKGLSRGIGSGTGDWRLKLWSEDISVFTYMRTSDGFLTSLHDVVQPTPKGYWVPIFNPRSNLDQVSILRLINDGADVAMVEIAGLDDSGRSAGDVVRLSLEPRESRSLTAQELEAGEGLQGAFGDGDGKWRLTVTSDRPIVVASLIESPTGHLTNLSTVPTVREASGDQTVHSAPLFPSASDQHGRQGFLRVINPGAEELVATIVARDETAREFAPLSLTVRPSGVQQFNSDDLELGNAAKGLSAGVGSGEGDWRLEVTTPADAVVLAYIRTLDGFLTTMHDVVPLAEDGYVVPIFNPASNAAQVSRLRIVNPVDREATVTINGVDDRGVPHGPVSLSVAGMSARDIFAQELEAGGSDVAGSLGDGFGKWRLVVSADESVQVMSLLQSPTGHLTNLSSSPGDW